MNPRRSLTLAALLAAGSPLVGVKPITTYDHGVPRDDAAHLARAEAKRRRKGQYWKARCRWGLGTRNRRTDDK